MEEPWFCISESWVAELYDSGEVRCWGDRWLQGGGPEPLLVSYSD